MNGPLERDFGEKKRVLCIQYKGKGETLIPFDDLDDLKDRIEADPIEKAAIYRRNLHPSEYFRDLTVYIERQDALKVIKPYRKAPEPRQPVPRPVPQARPPSNPPVEKNGPNNGESAVAEKPQEIHLPSYEAGFIILGKDNRYKVDNGEEGPKISIDTFQGSTDGQPRKRTVVEILEKAKQGGYNFVATDEKGRYAYMFKMSAVPENLQSRTVSNLEVMISKGTKVSF